MDEQTNPGDRRLISFQLELEHVAAAIYASSEECRLLVEHLEKLEKFYDSLGGLLGYQQKSLQLLSGIQPFNSSQHTEVDYLMPNFLDLSKEDSRTTKAVMSGITALPFMAEIYALGGSGDRLGLQCPDSGDLLPSAMLPYCGRSMLDSMIRDVQVRWMLHHCQ